jgi:apolipoprotein N-acyltransferase
MAVARCVETGCGMARCANSGISVGVDPWGRTFGETPLFQRKLSVVDVPLRRGRTLFDRLGDWVGAISIGGSIAAALAAVAYGRRVR